MASQAEKRVAKQWRFPVLEGVLPLDRKRIPADLIAGATLAALAIPEVMGYTKIAGMPVITGLYTILIPIAVFALLGSSRHLVVGADSATAAILFAGLTGLAVAPDSAEWVALAGWLAILTAGFLIVARVLKLGFLADFLSRSVLIGFLTGVGIQVACGQIAGMLGVEKTGSGPLAQAVNAILAIPTASMPTVAVSAAVLIVIVGGGMISKKIPAALIAVVGSIAASAWLGLAAMGVATLGTVPSGLPAFGVPTLPSGGQWASLVATAGSLFLVILAQSAATSRAYAVKYSEQFDENVDLVGLSFSNVAAGPLRYVPGQRKSDQDGDGRRGGGPKPDLSAHDLGDRALGVALLHPGVVVHAQRRALDGGLHHRSEAGRSKGNEIDLRAAPHRVLARICHGRDCGRQWAWSRAFSWPWSCR